MPSSRNRPHHRWILVLLTIGLVVTFVLALAAGNARVLELLVNVDLLFVCGIVLFQALRYAAMTVSTRVVAEIVELRVPVFPLFQATVAAAAANRTFVGGAAGLVIRGEFLIGRGMHGGTFAAVEGVEDVVSLCAICLMFVGGLGYVFLRGQGAVLDLTFIGILVVAAVGLTLAAIAFLRRRALVERIVDALARAVSRIVEKIARKRIYDADRVRGAVSDFYGALALARRDPLRVFISFSCALARLGCDWIALFFAFRAIGSDVSIGTVLLIFVVSSSVATIAAVPGQIGVMETTLTLVSTALGVPPPVAVGAALLYRVISFWLPIPFGYAFAWNLQRRGLI